ERVGGEGRAQRAVAPYQDAEIGAERQGGGRVHEVAVRGCEGGRRDRDRRRGAEPPLEAALHEAAKEQLLGAGRDEREDDERERELRRRGARQHAGEARERGGGRRTQHAERGFERVREREQPERRERDRAGVHAPAPQAEPLGERRRRERRAADGEQDEQRGRGE